MKQEIIRLGSDCNQKCIFCNQEENIPKKSKKSILWELLEMRKRKIEDLIISWWEPTLFKEELIFTIKIWKKLWFKNIELQSNAVLLSDFNYSKLLFDVWLDSAMISLHHFEEEFSDEITQAKGTFKKTIVWIKNLINVWVRTSLNIVINRKNYKFILDYVKYIDHNIKGFDDISLSIVVPWKLTKQNNLLPKYSEIAPFLIKAYKYCIENNIEFQNPWCWIPVCYVKDFYTYSMEYSNYKSWKMYNESDLEKNKKNKIKSEKCKKCIFDKYCLWLWKWYVELYWFDDLVPIYKL